MFKKIAAIAAVLAAATSLLAIPAFADSDTKATTAVATYDSPIPDYYGDDKYDTKGNLSLIREEKIIYDSEEMQFIAVTTKDGHVFYILIDYTAIKAAESGEDGADARQTVYFLNKVDDYDLFTLLYDDTDTDLNAAYHDRGSTSESGSNMDTDSTQDQTNQQTSTSPGMPMWLIMIICIGAVGGIYWFVKIRPNSSNKKAEFDDDDLDFDDEVNIDTESKDTNELDNNGSEQTEDLSIYGSPDDDEDLM